MAPKYHFKPMSGRNVLKLDTAMGRVVVPVHSQLEVLARMITLLITNLVRLAQKWSYDNRMANGRISKEDIVRGLPLNKGLIQ